MLYVVDARQGEHFRLLFETARQWGYSDTEFAHVSFGTVLGDDRRPFQTRSGDTVGLESLIDEAIARGDPGCRGTVFLTPSDEESGAREYFRRIPVEPA